MEIKNEVVAVDISQEGEGIAKTEEGYTVFVPYLLPGERAFVKYTSQGRDFARGEILEFLETSPMRTDPPCPVYRECGGCQLALELRGTAPLEGEKGSRQPNPNSKTGQSQGQSHCRYERPVALPQPRAVCGW